MTKTRFNVPVTFRLSPSLKDWLSDYANRADVNEANILRDALSDYLGKHDVPTQQPINTVIQPLDIAEHNKNMEEINIVVSQLKELIERLNTPVPASLLFDNSHEAQ
jgi:hypothetical protein